MTDADQWPFRGRRRGCLPLGAGGAEADGAALGASVVVVLGATGGGSGAALGVGAGGALVVGAVRCA